MRYTVNNEGAFFTDDNDTFNSVSYNSFADALDLFHMLFYGGFGNVYIKDEEYQVSYAWDSHLRDFVWDY